MNWHDKSILVLGAGETGVSVARWAVGMGARVRVADTRDDPPGAAQLAALGAACELVAGAYSDALFRDAELVVASPGVAVAGPARDPAIARAIAQGKKFVGDVELFAWEQNEINERGLRPKMIGITGSNGKSTVTAMAGAMCRAAGLKTVVAGNIGLPVLDAAMEAREHGQPDAYVVELSSFQLETTSSLQCDSAAMLNLSQDHLDRYDSMADYASAKQRIFLHAAHQVLNREDLASMAMRNHASALSTFGIDAAPGSGDFGIADGWLMESGTRLMPLADMPVAGLHNAANALAAFALCGRIGGDAEKLAAGLKEFQGLPHRVENVGVIDGVTYYDDSKGTNVGSTVAALNGMTMPVVLIAGGIGKEQDFSPLAEPVRRRARAIVLIGKDARLIESAITSARVTVIHAESMADAVEKAQRAAVAGDAVLLSPACSSFDMFRNYNHRGDVFAQCVRELKSRQGGGNVV
ncbi:MAG: UDP-N-acetylmuramoyl-L-alanine--D-glutamate ligase [Betaproteobacteria bacterium]|nr:UDP-N-acetylmuramoyl-L-alanine--D-glutamate ligase [Betaproteobacteria bacterium]